MKVQMTQMGSAASFMLLESFNQAKWSVSSWRWRLRSSHDRVECLVRPMVTEWDDRTTVTVQGVDANGQWFSIRTPLIYTAPRGPIFSTTDDAEELAMLTAQLKISSDALSAAVQAESPVGGKAEPTGPGNPA